MSRLCLRVCFGLSLLLMLSSASLGTLTPITETDPQQLCIHTFSVLPADKTNEDLILKTTPTYTAHKAAIYYYLPAEPHIMLLPQLITSTPILTNIPTPSLANIGH